MYHAVGDELEIAGADPHYAVTIEKFEKQIRRIAKSEPIAAQFKRTGRITQDCITFDDGHVSNYTVAFPALKALGLGAEFYVNTATVGTDCYMSWEQLRELSIAGMSIQSHGHNHRYFSTLSESEIRDELRTSKHAIEAELDQEVIIFAPPGGRYDSRVVSIAKQEGYECIATSVPGVYRPPAQRNEMDFIQLPRFAVRSDTTAENILAWQYQYSYATLAESMRYQFYRLLKRLLGNRSYDNLRLRLLKKLKSR